jgi:rhodanese-related sulfurtransferase
MRKSGALFSSFGLAQLLTLLAVGAALWLAYDPWSWGRLKEDVRTRFPGVPTITTGDLADWLKQPVVKPVLLDARSEAEYNASHLPGALPASVPAALAAFEGRFEQPIVVYCTVGFESAPIARRLIAQGYNRVQYLEGGIFFWANQGEAMENVRGAATKVDGGKSPYISYLQRSRRF